MAVIKLVAPIAFLSLAGQIGTALAEGRIVSGDWVAGCVEQYDNGSASVYCDRFGGFIHNVFPSGCDGRSMFACQSMTICDLARQVSVLDATDFTKLQDDVLICEGEVRGPASFQ